MDLIGVIDEINRQAYLQSKAVEIYEEEACEVLAFDCILNYYRINYPDSVLLHEYGKQTDEEDWMIMSRIFTDYISDKVRLNIEDDILFLLEVFYQRFYLNT